MSRKVSEKVIAAFLAGAKKTDGNSMSSGNELLLHGNKIAMRDADGNILMSSAGWCTSTTRERLNCLLMNMGSTCGLSIKQGEFILSDRTHEKSYAWDGKWIKVPQHILEIDSDHLKEVVRKKGQRLNDSRDQTVGL